MYKVLANSQEVKMISSEEILKSNFTFHKFVKGQVIFYKDHIPYGLFILLSGAVCVEHSSKRKVIVKEPSFLGINSFKNKTPYIATAKAISDCDICFISYFAFEKLEKKKKYLINNLMI